MERLKKLKKAIDNKINLLGDDFWSCEEIPYIIFEGTTINHIFYDEISSCEVDPVKYYNISNTDLEKFFKYYNV